MLFEEVTCPLLFFREEKFALKFSIREGTENTHTLKTLTSLNNLLSRFS